MDARKPIEGNMSVMESVMLMSEGNPGAIRVLTDLMANNPDEAISLMLCLDDMNVRGSQIWVGWKDFANMNNGVFVQAIKERNSDMVDKINEQCSYSGEVAVISGASFKR